MFIDTHAHIDGEEFDEDREEVLQRARQAGAEKIFVPAIDLASSRRILDLCRQYPGFLYPMVGLHPEEVRSDWREQLAQIHQLLEPFHPDDTCSDDTYPTTSGKAKSDHSPLPARGVGGEATFIGEVGLDFYWSREYEHEQLEAFEEQVRWSIETRRPLMIHCRKAQNEMVRLLRPYAKELPGGVFHCFTGNEHEAEELLQFDRFVLGIGGVFTFKKSHLPEVLPAAVPLDRLVLETDAPYMAPAPMRGKRNEPSFVPYIISGIAQAYGISEEALCQQTNANVTRILEKCC